MSKPLAIDLFSGLGGWTEGLLSEGYFVAGFDIEQHVYGEQRYPAHLVLQDVRTIHGSQFKDAALIVASPPCQEYSYMAMPWTRAKQIAKALRGGGEFPDGYKGSRTIAELNALFDACFRIQREASQAAGRHIPMVVENVKGAQPWVGRARWSYGSYYLWGDVPALMPMTIPRPKVGGIKLSEVGFNVQACRNLKAEQAAERAEGLKNPGFRFDGRGKSFQSESVERATKNAGGSWFNIGSPGQKVVAQNPVHEGTKTVGHANRRDGHSHTRHLTNQAESDGVKFSQSGAAWFDGKPRDKMLGDKGPAAFGSKSSARKAASARIAKIPAVLARHIAHVYRPETAAVA